MTDFNRIEFLSLGQKILFTTELQHLLASQISVMQTLDFVEKNVNDKKIKNVCASMSRKINAGMTFSQALNYLYGNVFGLIYISVIKAGEEAGELDVALNRMLVILRKQEKIRNKIITASIYPIILICVICGILILFAKIVFPNITKALTYNGADIPALYGFFAGVANFINNHGFLLIFIFIAFIIFIVNIFKTPAIKAVFDRILMRIPLISDFVEYLNLSKFTTVMGMSYDSGLPILSCLDLASRAVGNVVIRERINNSILFVRKGATIAHALQQVNAIPPDLMTIIASGEQSGSLGKMFKNASEIIDKRVDFTLSVIAKLFEPISIVIIGIIVGSMIISFAQVYTRMLFFAF